MGSSTQPTRQGVTDYLKDAESMISNMTGEIEPGLISAVCFTKNIYNLATSDSLLEMCSKKKVFNNLLIGVETKEMLEWLGRISSVGNTVGTFSVRILNDSISGRPPTKFHLRRLAELAMSLKLESPAVSEVSTLRPVRTSLDQTPHDQSTSSPEDSDAPEFPPDSPPPHQMHRKPTSNSRVFPGQTSIETAIISGVEDARSRNSTLLFNAFLGASAGTLDPAEQKIALQSLLRRAALSAAQKTPGDVKTKTPLVIESQETTLVRQCRKRHEKRWSTPPLVGAPLTPDKKCRRRRRSSLPTYVEFKQKHQEHLTRKMLLERLDSTLSNEYAGDPSPMKETEDEVLEQKAVLTSNNEDASNSRLSAQILQALLGYKCSQKKTFFIELACISTLLVLVPSQYLGVLALGFLLALGLSTVAKQ